MDPSQTPPSSPVPTNVVPATEPPVTPDSVVTPASTQPVKPPVTPVQSDTPPPPPPPAAPVPEEVKVAEELPSLQSDIPTPPNAMSGPLKEFGPTLAAPVAEVLTPSDAEPDIPQEVKEAGVEASPNTEQPNISPQVQQLTGIKPVSDAVPLPTAPSDTIQLPMPEPEAEQLIKTKKVADSIRWLATLIVEQTKRAHGKLLGK